VDHGKTALITALTGTNTDRLKEERERGISIELGFAEFDLGDGVVLGVVDMPGHEKFVKQMVSGAGGVDLAFLVVAADESHAPDHRAPGNTRFARRAQRGGRHHQDGHGR
jgi:selenocysteine-specific elongation factor